ncbi:MAG: hypothetical protein M0Q23_03085 [Syntrophales bacterium]|jgi:D-alanine-D-alanine ligase|nr:hypothetical protein [Syntrophales bacterium]MCK9527630.1 hypothetical protein [Syntrophales bacterium]MDX9922247.1 hypothetical protein [Syntrophales bacterium]
MKKPLIALVHNVPASEGAPGYAASLDVIVQLEAVEEALGHLGYPFSRVPFTRDLHAFLARFRETDAGVIFNLCETVDEDASLGPHPAAVFELMDIPFTGSSSQALMYSTDKGMAKLVMAASGINTPGFLVYDGHSPWNPHTLRFPVIVKPRFEDAGIGIDQESICEDPEALAKFLPLSQARFGECIVEEYINGREFNLSVICNPSPTPLPVAEIDYSSFPEGLYPILGYAAKWDVDSPEYVNSPRVFPADLDDDLAHDLEETALLCFRLFHLRDYGRVDMRLTSKGEISVLEINANPCLSPDAGFAAAFGQTGGTYAEMIGRILASALNRTSKP